MPTKDQMMQIYKDKKDDLQQKVADKKQELQDKKQELQDKFMKKWWRLETRGFPTRGFPTRGFPRNKIVKEFKHARSSVLNSKKITARSWVVLKIVL